MNVSSGLFLSILRVKYLEMRYGLNHLDKEGVIRESKIIEEKEGKDVAVIKTTISKLGLKQTWVNNLTGDQYLTITCRLDNNLCGHMANQWSFVVFKCVYS